MNKQELIKVGLEICEKIDEKLTSVDNSVYERERFIEAATKIMRKNFDCYVKTAEAMFDAGFRAPEGEK